VARRVEQPCTSTPNCYAEEVKTKTCIDCRQAKATEDFSRSGKYLRSYCKECSNQRSRAYAQANKARRNERLREWRRRNPEAAKSKDERARLARKYGLTPQQVDEMSAAQGGRCLLCERSDRALVVDHCHDTGRVRGLLCRSCNTLLGQIEGAPHILSNLDGYLAHGNTTSGLASSKRTSA